MHPVGNSDRSGITRTDVVSLLAVGSLLAVLLLVGTGMSRSRSGSAQCVATLHQLIRAWQLYAVDHGEAFAYNMGVAETTTEITGRNYRNWVNNNISWDTSSYNTNEFLAVRGGIGPYVDGGPLAFVCPSDRYLSPAQVRAGWKRRLRSRSMNAFIGPYSVNSNSDPSVNTFIPQYRQFLRLSQLSKPDRIFVLIDEHPDSINDGYFLNSDTASGWGDLPASLHDGAGGFAFSDGHVEIHAWQSPATQLPVRFNYTGGPVFGTSGRADFAWYKERVPYERRP